MAYVPIPKDLNKVKTKVAFNLTKRQIIGFVCAGIVGFPTYLMAKNAMPNDVAIILMVCVTLPFFFVTFYEKDGLPFEKIAKYIYLSKRYQPKERFRKEVYLEKQAEKARKDFGTKRKKLQKEQKRPKKV